MSIEMPETYTYENNILQYEFRNNDFTNELYKEFDHKATKLGLNSKIDDLLSGKIVNPTEVKNILDNTFGSTEVKTFGEENQLKITTKYKVDI